MTSAHFLLAIALLAAAPAPARAISAEQTMDVDRLAELPVPGKSRAYAMAAHYAVLLWVEDFCDGQSDESVRKYIMTKGRGDELQFETGWTEAMALWK